MKVPEASRRRAKNEGNTPIELTAEIRRRAYELYEQRGRADGHMLEDWMQAEAEVLDPEGKPAAA